jgi:hypothetical protein
VRRCEKAVDNFFISAFRFVGEKSIEFFLRWGKPSEVEGDAAEESALVRFRRWLDWLAHDFVENELIDRVANLFFQAASDCGWGGFLRGNKGPVLCPFGSGLDPFANEFDFLFRERLFCLRRRHQFVRVF